MDTGRRTIYILGVQSRYLIGILPLVFLVFTNQNKQMEKVKDFLRQKLF